MVADPETQSRKGLGDPGRLAQKGLAVRLIECDRRKQNLSDTLISVRSRLHIPDTYHRGSLGPGNTDATTTIRCVGIAGERVDERFTRGVSSLGNCPRWCGTCTAVREQGKKRGLGHCERRALLGWECDLEHATQVSKGIVR